jgi:hypothetical protein
MHCAPTNVALDPDLRKPGPYEELSSESTAQ